MNGTRIMDEILKKCVKKAGVEIHLVLYRLRTELFICNKLAFRAVKGDQEKKLMLKNFMESAKQIARDAKSVIHVCTGEEQEAFFKCLAENLRKMKAQKVEDVKQKCDPQVSPAEMDHIVDCYTNSFTVAQLRLTEIEKRFRECINETKK